ncbi:Peptidyl-prolyl cis-trans isomerase CWC27 like protein [Eufriesea mexicana]|uniref:Spliceosome-associated protein CWC27 homolog n=1 Tax=Eufriesea mexicana TaxID=516756 RepID=A0A310SJM5_9HYME|nr:Peptidyl-prolyl cis-trans isomerase CWC27 like protein [Eufriesea mexicana]
MTLFHSIINGFTTQSGDPASIGEAGKIYGEPLKDKFHTRLHFRRQDLIVTANAGKDDKGFQFFFTLSSTPDLHNKRAIFDKVTGETLYNMLKLDEALVDENHRPLHPPKMRKTEILNNPFSDIIPRIIVQESEEVKDSLETKTAGNHRPLHPPKMRKTEILNNPFSDIIPRIIVQESEEVKDSLETKTAGVKDFDLLSFDEEAKGDEEESVILNEKISGEDKSAHDHLSGSKLSSQPADEPPGFANKKERKTAVVIRKVSMK